MALNPTYLPVNKHRTELLAISTLQKMQETMQKTMTQLNQTLKDTYTF